MLRFGMRRLALAAAALAALIAAAASGAATQAPRLTGSFPTVLTLTKVVGSPELKQGQSGHGTWTFTPQCATGSCATTLARPDRQAGSTANYVKTLSPTSADEYSGHSKAVLTACVFPNGKRVAGGYRTTQTITLHVSDVVKGKVVAYTGTMATRGTATESGRHHGCPGASEQYASFKSTGRP
jgi:hypothetical protein